MKKLLLLLLIVAAAVVAWGVLRKSEPPHVPFARVKRQTLVSTLPTNGKVEPFEWQAVRSEAAGVIHTLHIHEGQSVSKDQPLADLTDPALEADVQTAQAKVAEARAGLTALQSGGRPVDLTDIDNRLERARHNLQQATAEYESLRRLAEKQAATRVDVQSARDRVRDTELEIEGLTKRRTSLVAPPDVSAAQARLDDAEAALALARRRAAYTVIRAPLAGVVYGLAVQTGAYLKPGDLVTNIGRLDRLRVRVYVDEPELGRVAAGQPVTIRWQALPRKEWQGVVESKPTSIQALGSRQVGEVICIIENPGRELIPGTNVDAEIRTAVVENALVVPRESLRHDTAGDFVFILRDGALERRPVQTGVSSITLVQILSGLSEADQVALPTDVPLKPGDKVIPNL